MLGDLLGAARELGHERLRDAGDLIAGLCRMTPSPRLPTDTELGRQKVGEDSLVELRERRRRLEDGLGIKGPPLAVRH